MSDRSKHITDLKINSFKSFTDFEMNDIGQFNLILGDNNVGKTSVLEALEFDKNIINTLTRLLSTLTLKNTGEAEDIAKTNYIKFFQNNLLSKSIISIDFRNRADNDFTTLKLLNVQPNEVTNNEKKKLLDSTFINSADTHNDVAKLLVNEKSSLAFLHAGLPSKIEDLYSPFISANASYAFDLTRFYSSEIQQSRTLKSELITNLSLLIPEIEDIEISTSLIPNNSILILRLSSMDHSIPLSLFGDGAIKLFRILVEIIICKGKRLMIDEIDTGIHYSRFKDFWKTILLAAYKNDVQLFATTHNVECLKYFKEAMEAPELAEFQDRARSFTLMKLPNGKTKAYNYNFEKFENAVERDIEIRGGQKSSYD